MKKKVIAMLLVVLMAVSLLIGCNKDPGPTQTNPKETTPKQTQGNQDPGGEEKPKEIINISLYMGSFPEEPSQQAVIDAMNAYSAEKIGVTISYKGFVAGEYLDKLTLALATNEDVDIAWMDRNTYTSLAAKGALMDLTDTIKEYDTLYNMIPERIWESAKVDGKNYCVPNLKEAFSGNCLMTPKALADTIKEKYGIDFNAIECDSIFEIGAFEEYILAAMQEGVEIPVPYQVRHSSFIGSDKSYESVGKAYLNLNRATKKIEMGFAIPEFREYVELMVKWNELGIWKEEQMLSDFKATNYLKSGDYALGRWATVPDGVNNATARYGQEVYLNEIGSAFVQSNSALGSGWVITNYTEKAEACMKWIELLNTDTTFADMFVYGIEGTHYTRTADGYIEVIKDSGWNGSTAAWRFTNYMIPTLMTTDSPDKKEQYTAANETAVSSELMGFRPDFTKVEAEVAACDAIVKSFGEMFHFGVYGTAELDDVIKQFEQAGVYKIIEEIQGQVDAFLTGK